MLARTEMIEEIGLLDPEFFSYREENDWGMRGYKNKWKSVYIHKAKIWHKGGGSTRTGKPKLLAIYYMTRNRFLFMKKHANAWQLLSFLLYFFGFQFWFRSGVYVVYHRDIKAFKSLLKGAIDGVKMFQR